LFYALKIFSLIISVLVFSGRELFMADASVFVDDAEAYEVYAREESEANEEPVKNIFLV
jgi:hypothetical protein